MTSNEQKTPHEALADLDAVLKHISAATPVAPELANRVRARSGQLTEELRLRFGELNVAVDLIREVRNEE